MFPRLDGLITHDVSKPLLRLASVVCVLGLLLYFVLQLQRISVNAHDVATLTVHVSQLEADLKAYRGRFDQELLALQITVYGPLTEAANAQATAANRRPIVTESMQVNLNDEFRKRLTALERWRLESEHR
jgi:hypothetical protein